MHQMIPNSFSTLVLVQNVLELKSVSENSAFLANEWFQKFWNHSVLFSADFWCQDKQIHFNSEVITWYLQCILTVGSVRAYLQLIFYYLPNAIALHWTVKFSQQSNSLANCQKEMNFVILQGLQEQDMGLWLKNISNSTFKNDNDNNNNNNHTHMLLLHS